MRESLDVLETRSKCFVDLKHAFGFVLCAGTARNLFGFCERCADVADGRKLDHRLSLLHDSHNVSRLAGVSVRSPTNWRTMFLALKPSKEEVERFIDELSRKHFSYPDVGASVYGAPKKYNVDHHRIRLGRGAEVWKRAVEGLKRWEMFKLGWTELCWP